MVQYAKVLVAKPDNLSSSSRAHMLERGDSYTFFSDLHKHTKNLN